MDSNEDRAYLASISKRSFDENSGKEGTYRVRLCATVVDSSCDC